MNRKIGNYIILFFLILSILPSVASALEANVEVSPDSPVVGENFNVKFKIKLQNSDDEPNVSFDPGSAEVLGKENIGLSIQTMIINGKLSTVKEMVVVYQMISNRTGKIRIGDIKIENNGGVTKIPDIQINVIDAEKREKHGDVFVVAIPSKKQVYTGEGFNVDYFLYYRVPAGAKEITEFPKLNNFTKRFQTPNDGNERVIFNGESFVRQRVYGARLYSNRIGKHYIDPIKLKVQYSDGNQDSSLNGFGFAFRQYKTAVFASKKIEITVMPIPIDNVPKSFTGLVGKHTIKFSLNETKFLVNQPIEYSLEISGGGMLETFEPPKIFTNENLEAFDTKSDFEEQGSTLARKRFEYTTLPRGPLNIAEQEQEISYFLPEENKFEVQKIKIPAIRVEGEAAPRNNSENNSQVTSQSELSSTKTISSTLNRPLNDIEILPIYFEDSNLHFLNILTIQKLLFVLIIILFLSFIPFREYFNSSFDSEIKRTLSSIYKEGIDYQKMFTIFNFISSKNEDHNIKNFELSDNIKSWGLSDGATRYFLKLFETLEKMSYEGKAQSITTGIEKKFFKELESFLRKIK